MSIGARVREERERLGYNQTDFAGLGDASLRSQIEWEKGKAFPNAKVLAAIAAAGADVQYILTGVPSANALAPDEQLLLERYRSSPQAIRDAALRVLLIGGAESSRPGVVIHGSVGQQIDTQTAKNITVNMPKK
jgi:transcriptional regulator with XRE-family HTH domain